MNKGSIGRGYVAWHHPHPSTSSQGGGFLFEGIPLSVGRQYIHHDNENGGQMRLKSHIE